MTLSNEAIEKGWQTFQRITHSPLPLHLGGYEPSKEAFMAGLLVALEHQGAGDIACPCGQTTEAECRKLPNTYCGA